MRTRRRGIRHQRSAVAELGLQHETESKLAEEVGFEPTVPLGTTVFKTAAFNHSAIPPQFSCPSA